MATLSQSDNSDLDRTDELPKLDVAAYEMALRAAGNDLGNTDTWAAEGLRNGSAADTGNDSGTYETALMRSPFAARTDKKVSDITHDAGQILDRIAQLESELSAVRTLNSNLEAQRDSLADQTARKDRDIRGLTADNSRLTEQQATLQQKTGLLGQQWRDEAAGLNERLSALQTEFEVTRASADLERTRLENQLREQTSRATEAGLSVADLTAKLNESITVNNQQADALAALRRDFAEEERDAEKLARHLAERIAECATLNKSVERRELNISSLLAIREELAQQLDQSRNANATLAARLDEANANAARIQAAAEQKEREVFERDRKLSELADEHTRTENVLGSTSRERDAALGASAAEREEHERTRIALVSSGAQIAELQKISDDARDQVAALHAQLTASAAALDDRDKRITIADQSVSEAHLRRDIVSRELDAARSRIVELEADTKIAFAVRSELASKTQDLDRTDAQIAALTTQVDTLKKTLDRQTVFLAGREELLQATQKMLDDLQAIGISLREEAEASRATISSLESVQREQADQLRTTIAELGSARRQVAQQLPAIHELEQGLSARESLAHDLRNELRTAQDERAIIAGQLEKSRVRNKKMARDIFARDQRINALKADLAVHMETLAAIRHDVNRMSGPAAEAAVESVQRVLEPVGHDGDPIMLNRKVMTLGRTEDNDVCIPSKLVSRHHARLLIGPNAVIVEDAGSTNGCFINDRQIDQQLMGEGDILMLGDLKYRLASRQISNTRMRDNVVPFVDPRPDPDSEGDDS